MWTSSEYEAIIQAYRERETELRKEISSLTEQNNFFRMFLERPHDSSSQDIYTRIENVRDQGRAEAFKILLECNATEFLGSEILVDEGGRIKFSETALRKLLQPDEKHLSLISYLERTCWDLKAKIYAQNEQLAARFTEEEDAA